VPVCRVLGSVGQILPAGAAAVSRYGSAGHLRLSEHVLRHGRVQQVLVHPGVVQTDLMSSDARWAAGLLTIVVISGLVIYDAMTTPLSMITGN
jgi:hypothetical protein